MQSDLIVDNDELISQSSFLCTLSSSIYFVFRSGRLGVFHSMYTVTFIIKGKAPGKLTGIEHYNIFSAALNIKNNIFTFHLHFREV